MSNQQENSGMDAFTTFVAATTVLTLWAFWLTIVATIAYDWYRG